MFLLEWILPLLVLIPLFYLSGPYQFAFTESPTHLILLRATQQFMKVIRELIRNQINRKVAAGRSTRLSSLNNVLFDQLTPIFYHIWAFDKATSNICEFLSLITYHKANFQPFISSISIFNLQTEVIILKCAFVSFMLFIPNFIKTTVLYFATDPEIVNIGTELW